MTKTAVVFQVEALSIVISGLNDLRQLLRDKKLDGSVPDFDTINEAIRYALGKCGGKL